MKKKESETTPGIHLMRHPQGGGVGNIGLPSGAVLACSDDGVYEVDDADGEDAARAGLVDAD